MTCPIPVEKLTRKAWLDLHERPDMISASQVSSVLNMNKFCNGFTLWAQKCGHAAWPQESFLMRMGHKAEHLIAQDYKRATGRKCIDPGAYAVTRHPDYPWIFSTLDRVSPNERDDWGAAEFKLTQIRDGWDEFSRGPINYQIQNQMQMHCAGLNWGALVGRVGRGYDELHIYEHERNDDFFKAILPKLKLFRYQCMNQEPPECIEYDDQYSSILKKLHPNDNGETVVLSAELVEKARQYTANNATMNTLKKENESIKAELMEAIGDNSYGDCGNGDLVKWLTTAAGQRRMTINISTPEEDE